MIKYRKVSGLVSVILWLCLLAQGQVPYLYRILQPTSGASATGNTGFSNTGGLAATFASLSWTLFGSLASCTIQIDFSNDGTTVAGQLIAAQTCTSSGSIIAGSSSSPAFVRVSYVIGSGGGFLNFVGQGCINSTCTTGGGGGGSGNTTSTALTTGFIPLSSGANSIVNSSSDEGITAANTLTVGDSLGVAANIIRAHGAGSGLQALTQGADNSTNCDVNSDCNEAPASIPTSFTRVGESAGPTVASIEAYAATATAKTQKSFLPTSNTTPTGIQTFSGTLTSNCIPKFNASGDLVCSALADTGALLTYTGTQGAVLPNGAVATPSLQFAAYATNTGWFDNSATSQCFANVGVNAFCLFGPTGFQVADNRFYSISQTNGGAGTGGVEFGAAGTGTTEAADFTQGTSTTLVLAGNTVKVTGSIATSGTAATVAQWTLPNVAKNWAWNCVISYTITSGTTPTLILNMNASVAPTNEAGNAIIYSNNTGTNTSAENVTSTATGNVAILTGVTAIAGTYRAETSGVIQATATSGTFAITASMGGTTPIGAITAGTFCSLN